MRRSIVEDLPFELHLEFWGAAYAGDVDERTAMLAEGSAHSAIPMWDRTARDLAHECINRADGQGCVPVPHWWMLPYVVENAFRLPASWQAVIAVARK